MAPGDLAGLLFGKARRGVLALLLGRPDEAFYLREIIRTVGTGSGVVQRELKLLSETGILERIVRGQQVFYRANQRCPIYPELNSLLHKTAGAADVLRDALAPLIPRIALAFIYGSVARGEQRKSSDIDLLIVGDVSLAAVLDALSLGAVQEKLGREVNPTVYPVQEFRNKLATGHHFLTTVCGERKIYLIGDEHELTELASKRVAERTSQQQTGDPGPARRSGS